VGDATRVPTGHIIRLQEQDRHITASLRRAQARSACLWDSWGCPKLDFASLFDVLTWILQIYGTNNSSDCVAHAA
jgi:hypothetical protein